MAVEVVCPICGFAGRIPDRFLEKPVRGQVCDTIFQVELAAPDVPPAPQPPAIEQRAEAPPTLVKPPPPVEKRAAPSPTLVKLPPPVEKRPEPPAAPVKPPPEPEPAAPERAELDLRPRPLRKKPAKSAGPSLVVVLSIALFGVLGLLLIGGFAWLLVFRQKPAASSPVPEQVVRRNTQPEPPLRDPVGRNATVADLIKRLDDPRSRADAIRALQDKGPAASAAVPSLLALASKQDQATSAAAVRALRKIGPPDKDLLPVLEKALKSEELDVCLYALDAIGLLGAAARSATPALAVCLKDQEPKIRQAAARALGGLGPESKANSWPLLIKALDDPDKDVCREAVEALDRLTPESKDSKALAALLAHQQVEVAVFAAAALAKLGPDGADAVPPLIELLKNSDHALRRAAARALLSMNAKARPATSRLLECLKDDDDEVRRLSLLALAKAGIDGAALTDVLRAVDKASAEDADAVGKALIESAQVQPADVHLLCKSLASEHAGIRVFAATGLRKLGPDAKTGVSQLTKALSDVDPGVRAAAAASLGLIGIEAQVASTSLLRTLADKDAKVREQASGALEVLGALSKEVLVELADALANDDRRAAVAAVLSKIGKPAVFQVVRLLTHRKEAVRLTAVSVLGDMGAAAAEALPALQLRKANDASSTVRLEARRAIQLIQKK